MIRTRGKGRHKDTKELAKCGNFFTCFQIVALFIFSMAVTLGGSGPGKGSGSGSGVVLLDYQMQVFISSEITQGIL